MTTDVTIITPSYNQGEFIRNCLLSVKTLTGAEIEHLIFDPGSTDESLQIIQSFSNVKLINEPDEGQADAVNKGMLMAKSNIIGWLNSDDEYTDATILSAVLERFEQPDKPDFVYGKGVYIDAQGKIIKEAFINNRPETFHETLKKQVGILQPAVFFRRSVVDRIGVLSKDLHFCLDYEYWIRAVQAGMKFAYIDSFLAKARYYKENKTMGQRGRSLTETCNCLKNKFGFVHKFWINSLAEFNVEGFDGIITATSNTQPQNPEQLNQEKKSLLYAYNGDHDCLITLQSAAPRSPEEETLRYMKELGIPLSKPVTLLPKDQKIQPGDLYRQVGDRKWKFDSAWIKKQFAHSAKHLNELKKSRTKDVCIIVGNGPSLRLTQKRLFENQDVFISNFAFRDSDLRRNAKFLCVVNYLVAEQGSHELNNIRDIIKIFPSFLSYCLNEGHNTLFLPSKGTLEFSKNVMENVSWKSTVTFFHLQLAYWLGYKKVLMVGFDHNYVQQPNAKEGDILICMGNDTNHFRADYFRGLKWQAADVNNMEDVYCLAKTAYEEDNREIVNCTIGGKLEIFRRGDLATELGLSTSSTTVSSEGNIPPNNQTSPLTYPRLLMIDSTPLGHSSATGQLKQTFLGNWPKDSFLQAWEKPSGHTSTFHTISIGETIESSLAQARNLDELVSKCIIFSPDVIYLRPIDSKTLLQFAEKVAVTLNKPLVIHMMDDWPERMRHSYPIKYQKLDSILRRLINRASQHLSICNEMSNAYKSRYGFDWKPLANGVDLNSFPGKNWKNRAPITSTNPFIIRYMGALADDMTYNSVGDIARAVSLLHDKLSVLFEIHTMDWCLSKARKEFGCLPGVLVSGLVSIQDYPHFLCQSDALVIAYNFDPRSIKYIRLSLANKIPECLASGSPVLAYGPSDVASINYLKQSGCAHVIDQRNQDALCNAIKTLVTDITYCNNLGEKARRFVSEHLTKHQVQQSFLNVIQKAIAFPKPNAHIILGPFERGLAAHYDETDCIAYLYSKVFDGSIMIDVGAHHGWALTPFLDKCWNVFAFEPDNKNRQKLLERLTKHPNTSNIRLDNRAVSNKIKKGLSFYRSDESTGISGLSAFHPSHKTEQTVDTITLTEALISEPINTVDFLKIDTEGHDLFVLQGFPWDRFKPAVIECEFEDTKTVPLGYTFHDLARYLLDKGYTVYVSEWHPIIRYGIRHDWNRLVRYPCELADDKAWGNLLAFRDPIDEAELVKAVHQVLKFGNPQATAPKPAAENVTTPKPVVIQKPSTQDAGKPAPSPSPRQRDTLVILGNGPSLRGFDFARLQGFDTIGMNAAYRYWQQIGWYPTYYLCLDTVVTESHKAQIHELIQNSEQNGIRRFLVRRNLINSYPHLRDNPKVVIFDDYLESKYFAGIQVTTGSLAPLFAAMLGYRKVCLLGIDLNYVQQIPEAAKVEGHVLEIKQTPRGNPNYFFDDYQQQGDRYNIPDSTPDLHYRSWVAAKQRLDALGVDVINGNPRSRVDLFDRITVDTLLS